MSTDDTADDVESIDDPEGSPTYAYAYVTGLFVLIAAALVGSVYFGFVTPDVTVTVDVSIGWLVEYTAAGLAGLFFLWSFAQIANVVGMGFIGGVFGVIARIADNYELPTPDDGGEDDTDGDGGDGDD